MVSITIPYGYSPRDYQENILTDNRNGKSYEYNIIDGTRGPSVVDISTFYKDSGMFTYDPGYTSTASCESKITFIDGENSELRYRGYDISELAGKHSFLDVSYLLMRGKLPTPEASKNTMTLTDNRNGKSYEYNIIDGTRGPSVVDISTFYKDSGMFTYDPGYTSTASCESKIT